MIDLKCGDCLELMKEIPDKSIDMILCDPPYGTTRCEWDRKLDLDRLWEQYKRIIKDTGAILLFSQQPFSTDLICSNRKMFRYEIIWEKPNPTGFLNANKMPMRAHENILVFYRKLPVYNPIFSAGKAYKASNSTNRVYGKYKLITAEYEAQRYPRDVIKSFNKNFSKSFMPTQKPVPLLEYFIKTYTNEGDVVLDNCMGSGSTGVACVNLERSFIGMELNEEHFRIAEERIELKSKA